MRQPKCPYCFSRHEPTTCPDVQETIPPKYIKEYDKVPPIWLVTVGFEKHGKTYYLAALTMILEELDRVWPGTTYRLLDLHTQSGVTEMRREAIEGLDPKKTKETVPRPLFISVYDIPGDRSNCLVMYDMAGEIYRTISGDLDEGYFKSLKAVRNIWFMVSLWDLDKGNNQTKINDLLTSYLDGMERLGWPLAGRNLIVVYTKGDKIFNQPEYNLPEEIKSYFENDPFRDLTNFSVPISEMPDFELEDYVEDMKKVSDQLEEYTRTHIRGGGAFINLARRNGLGLYFTLTSATGTSPIDGRLQQEATRYRVLDPYLWAVHLNPPEVSRPISLVLDAATDCEPVYEKNIADFADKLADYGDVVTYFMGQTHYVSVSGQYPPTSSPSKHRLKLIGPLLDNADPQSYIVVLAAGKIHDLGDFANTPWADRLLLVAVGEDEYQPWSNMVIIRSNDSLSIALDEFQRSFSIKPVM
jgi:hypothetical protein